VHHLFDALVSDDDLIDFGYLQTLISTDYTIQYETIVLSLIFDMKLYYSTTVIEG